MKKKLLLIVCCVLVFALCATALISCKTDEDNTINEATLEALLQSAKDGYAETANVKENFTVSGTVSRFDEEKDEMVKVNIKWTPSVNSVTATLADGIVTVAFPASRSEDLTFTLTATLVDADGKAYTRADGTEYSFTITRTAVATNPALEAQTKFYNSVITAPQVGTTYKLAAFKQYTAWYFDGATKATNGNRLATTPVYANGTSVQLEAADEAGKYYVTFMDGTTKKYVDLYADAGSSYDMAKTAIVTDKAQVKGLFEIHSTGALYTTTTNSRNNTLSYYLCMRNSQMPEIYGYDTKALNSEGWKTTDNAMLLVSEDMSYTPESWVEDEATVLAKAFALGDNEEIMARVSLTGTITNITSDTNNITIQVGDKSLVCYLMVGRDGVKVGDKIKVTGVIKNYKKDAATDAVIEFDAGCTCVMVQKAPAQIDSNVNKVATPAENTEYLIVINNEKLEKQYYLTSTVSSYYVASTKDHFAGVKFKFEAVDGGYKISYMNGSTKKYLGVTINDGHVNLTLDTETVWKIDEDGLYYTVGEGADATKYYMSTPGDKEYVGMYKKSDTTWNAFIGTLTEEASKATITVTEDANADISVDKTTANIGDTVTITVTPKNDYTISKVNVNGKEITAVEGGYSFVVEGNSTVSVVMLSPSGEAPKGSEANPYTVAEAMAAAPASGYSAEVWVEGIIVGGQQADKPKEGSGQQWLFYIADAANGTGMQIRYANLSAGVANPGLGDTVLVKGLLTQYQSTAQMSKNSQASGSDPVLVSIKTRANGTVKADTENANSTITFTSPEAVEGVATAANGSTVTFTVAADSGYAVASVKLGTSVLVAQEGVYSVIVNGDMEITVEVREEGVSREKYELTFTKAEQQSKVSSYTSEWLNSTDGITLNVNSFNNNNSGWDYIKTGRKDGNAVTASISTTAAIPEKLTSVVVNVKLTGKGNVAHAYLIISSTANFAEGTTTSIEFTSKLTGTNQMDVTIDIAEPAANMYYKVVFDCEAGSANGFVELYKITFNCEVATAPEQTTAE